MNRLYIIFSFFVLINISVSQDSILTSSNLPIIVISTFGENIPDEPKIPAFMGIIYNGSGNMNYVSDPFNHYEGNIGIERRGHSSQGFPKKQYALETRDADGENLNISLFGMPTENDWILYAPYSDKSLLRNVIAYDVARSLGFYAPRTQFCEVVLNDDYIGVYVFMEKIKKDTYRVDISDPEPDNITGGYILEIEAWNRIDSTDIYFAGEIIDKPYVIKFPKEEDLTLDQMDWIENYINEFEGVLYSDFFDDPDDGYVHFINLPSWIDFVLINEAFRNNDVFFSSSYLYKQQDGKLFAGPVWDFNIAMGNIDYGDNWLTEGWWLTENPWSSILLEDNHFEITYQIRWDNLRHQQLSNSSFDIMIDSYVELLEEAQERNFIRWPILGQYVWPNYYVGDTYEDEINYLRQWIEERLSWIDFQFNLVGEQFPVINEINYHSAVNFDSKDWIEILNPSEAPINVSGYVFKDEKDDHEFIIPENTIINPMDYIILCRNSNAFHLLYPDVPNYFGDFNFSLSNGGELLRLFDPEGTLIDYVDYDDSSPWPDEPDGEGPTLELKQLPRDNYHCSNWGVSDGHGTPGSINSVVVSIDLGMQ